MTEKEFRLPKSILLERLRDGRRELDSALVSVPAGSRRADGWTFKDVVAHLAAWERYSADRLRVLGAGDVDPGPPGEDEESFNDRARQVSLERTWDEVRDEYRVAAADLLEAVESLPDEVIAANDWLAAWVALANGPWHYREHLPDFAPD